MKTSIILLAGLATLCATPAVAETISIPVSFAGLDLNSVSGQQTLQRRVNNAVKEICGTPDVRDLKALTMSNKCKSESLNRAQTRVAIAIAASKPTVQTAAR